LEKGAREGHVRPAQSTSHSKKGIGGIDFFAEKKKVCHV
jgi:hypothetical protein